MSPWFYSIHSCSYHQTQAEYYLPQREKKYYKREEEGSILPLFADERSSLIKGDLKVWGFFKVVHSTPYSQVFTRGR
jgi:hypothetical protein